MVLDPVVHVYVVIKLGLFQHEEHLRVNAFCRLGQLELVLSLHDFFMDDFDLVSAEIDLHGVKTDTDSSLLFLTGSLVGLSILFFELLREAVVHFLWDAKLLEAETSFFREYFSVSLLSFHDALSVFIPLFLLHVLQAFD